MSAGTTDVTCLSLVYSSMDAIRVGYPVEGYGIPVRTRVAY
jgi:hypothetical protein